MLSFTLSSLSANIRWKKVHLRQPVGKSQPSQTKIQTPPLHPALRSPCDGWKMLSAGLWTTWVWVVYTVLFQPGGRNFLVWQGRKRCKIVHFRATDWSCWAGECFQLSCESEGWNVGEAAQETVNVINSVMRSPSNGNRHSEENKRSLTGKNDGKWGSFVNSSSVFGVCHLLL